MNKTDAFVELANIFISRGYQLFLVGGTVRDILLKIEIDDMDVVTDATPEEMKEFVHGDYTFSKMGSVKYRFNDVKFDITTLRKEESYLDSRHPNKVTFVKDLETDHVRRDFTVNAMYMDKDFNLYDYENGLSDLNNRLLRMVGDPYKRLEEDPLRIIRCLRFSLTYDFTIESELKNALMNSIKFLNNVSKDKIKMEIKKIKGVEKDKIEKLFSEYSIKEYLDMVK